MVDEAMPLEDVQGTMDNATEEAPVMETDAELMDSASVGEAESSEAHAETEDTTQPATSPDEVAALQAEIAALQQQMDALKQQFEERTGQYMRLAADFDNFRKRTQKEKEELEQRVKRDTLVELLPVVDNFERARSQIKPQGDEAMNIHKSYQGVYKDFVDRLKRIGVAPMRSEGKQFDPNLHEAVMRQPTSEHPEGTVIEELVRGYLLGDGVLRIAMVKVAAPPESSDAGEVEQSEEG